MKFILPAVIDKRKAVLIDLNPFAGTFPEPQADTYVVSWDGTKKPILSLSKSQFIQALSGGLKDYELGGLQITANVTEDRVVIDFKPNEGAGIRTPAVQCRENVVMACTADEYYIHFSLLSTMPFILTEGGRLDIALLFHAPERHYTACLRFYYAPPASIKEAGLDFGSEACQIMEGQTQDTRADHFDLYRAMKEKYGNADELAGLIEDNIEQHDLGFHKLYRSVFYMRRGIPPRNLQDNEFKYISGFISQAALNQHLQSWQLIPNLKLIANNTAILNSFPRPLQAFVYKKLLESVIKSFIASLGERNYLRFTLLVPNIYNVKQVNDLQRTVRDLLVPDFRGVEVGVISESDAAFLGALGRLNVQPNHFYIIVDCGKGTTDFSIVEVDYQSQCKTTYRNGFAGAGNLITFSFMEALLHYLQDFPSATEEAKAVFRERILEGIHEQPNSFLRKQLFEFCERCKHKYTHSLSIDAVSRDWESNFEYDEIFDHETTTQQTIISFIQALSAADLSIADWGGYIENAYQHIAYSVSNQLNFVYTMLAKKKIEFGGIVFSGRGFAFQPLAESMKNHLLHMEAKIGLLGKNNSRITSDRFIQANGQNLKLIAIRGIFNRSVILHTDIISTPVEVHVTESHAEGSPQKAYGGILEKLMELLFGQNNQVFDLEQNRMQVRNVGDLVNVRFVAGATTYMHNQTVSNQAKDAYIVQSRDGFHLLELDSSSAIIDASLMIPDDEANLNAEPAVIKSLFPGIPFGVDLKKYIFKKF